MRVPVRRYSFLVLLSGLAWSRAAQAQCLPLQLLTTGLAEGQPLTSQVLSASLPASEWEMHKPPTGATYWSFKGGETSPTPATPDTRLELRRSNQQTQFDVVLKTPRKECFNSLRAELRRAKLKAEPVTCVQCEAERFTAATYTVTVFNQQESFGQGKAPYPFVVVVHALTGAASGPVPAAN
ncbi:hypothetical protein GCM10027422_04280 [Hymenobacter arcticus]